MAKTKHVLNVTDRAAGGSAVARRLRKTGQIPAVVYTRGEDAKAISVPATEWEALSRYDVNLITLKATDGKETLALLKEVQNDFIRNAAMHLDFMAVRKDQVIEARNARIHNLSEALAKVNGQLRAAKELARKEDAYAE